MKGRILVLLLIFVFLFASGCAEEGAEPSTEEADTAEDVAVSQDNTVSGHGENYIVRLEDYGVVKPSERNILRGDTISWWSEKRQGNYVLVSEEGLFPDEKLSYRVSFTYAFNETGTYRFVVKDRPEMNATISVS